MDSTEYFWLTRKKEPKTKPKSRPLPKATQKYLEAEEEFTEALDNLEIKYEKKFQFKSTKHWRFDFHIVKLRLLIEIEGGPWSGGRGGKLSNKAWSLDRYDHAEEMGYKIERFHPDSILSGYVINWIKSELARIEDGANKTISTD
ncbi:TPA: hypothetical protein ACSISM_003814 [Acinetobacter baumannii]|uniref:hypothetical protein n=1 Tax=Acinetobacter baumannii TaxID=470 RepID=UPI00313E0BD6